MRMNAIISRRGRQLPSLRSWCGTARWVAIAIALTAWLGAGAAPASAKLEHRFIGSFKGTDTPQGSSFGPRAVGVDQASGDVYVVDATHHVVDKFTEAGVYAGVQITAAETPQVEFAFASFPTFWSGVTVDNSLGINAGDVYVSDTGHGVVDRFTSEGEYICQITGGATPSASECNGGVGSDTPAESMEPAGMAVSSSGILYVADRAHHVIDEFNTSGAYVGQIQDANITDPTSIALDASGNLYVTNFPSNVVKFDATGKFAGVVASNKSFFAVGVNTATGHAYVAQASEGSGNIADYDASGNLVMEFGSGLNLGLDADRVSGDIYVSEFSEGNVNIYGPLIVVPNVATEAASEVKPAGAVLHGSVDPDTADGGGSVTNCEFEYGTTESYGESVPCSPAAPYASQQSVSASVTLTPDTEYHFRVNANNASGYKSYGEDQRFTTPGPPVIENELALGEVHTATVHAEITPFGFGTTCHVQYVTEAQYKVSRYEAATTVPCSTPNLGSSFSPQEVSAALTGLQRGTTYDYRFIAANEAGEAAGEDQTFATFGIESFTFSPVDRQGKPYTQAGGHPYALHVGFKLASGLNQLGQRLAGFNIKDVVTELPVGFVGATTATPRCPGQLAEQRACEAATQVGMLHLITRDGNAYQAPVFNMVPPPGVPAQLSSRVAGVADVFVDANIRTGGDYGVTATVHSASTDEVAVEVELTLWGVPAENSPERESERYCPEVRGQSYGPPCKSTASLKPFLTNPSLCGSPLTAKLSIDTWQAPGEYATATSQPGGVVTGCERLGFRPTLATQPEARVADSPSGLLFDLKVPQNEAPEGLAAADVRKITVNLPAGMSLSPAAAEGLQACTPEEIGLSNGEPASCPVQSKVGAVEIISPLIPEALHGSVYVAQQGNNPFGSIFALYIVAEVDGAWVKLAGKVSPDPVTGQLTSTFENLPQLPFSEVKLNFFGGPRAPLATPTACGTFTTTSDLMAWSAPESGPDAMPSYSFPIESGCGLGFAPTFLAGVTDPQAGHFSNFVLSFQREDGEGQPSGLTMSLPPGLLGKVAGVPLCSEGDAIAGTCPAASQVGTVEAGAGPGPNPLFVPGRVYLTGPYKGGPYGLAVVVPAVAGPFNLGNVVVRQSLHIDPSDGHVTAISDPLPTIIQGVPLRMRRVDVYLNRPEFVVNPTSCAQMKIAGTLTSAENALANVSSRFQLTNCAALGFKPRLKAIIPHKASRRNGISLAVRLAYPKKPFGSQANIARVKVDLPRQLPSRLSTLRKACLDVVFKENPAACPSASRVGTATTSTPILPEPLSGPAYFVSHGGAKFPELDIVLSGDHGVMVILRGETQIKKGITSSTFRTIPDVPVGTFELKLPQGPDSALTGQGNLCKKALYMPTAFTAQNGLVIHQRTRITVTGCPRARKRSRRRKP